MIVINGMPFEPKPGCEYLTDFQTVYHTGNRAGVKRFREMLLKDLWAFVYFGLRITPANHPFVVKACREVQEGPKSHTLDIWAREHFKSTIITLGETMQWILNEPNDTHVIMSYNRPTAVSFLRVIKYVFEYNDFLRQIFDDILYEKPKRQAFAWSEDSGIAVKRTTNQKECTVEAYGLIEGMPTARHYRRRVYDDIMTLDLAHNPDQIEKVKQAFDMSQNLGCENDFVRIVGTPYHHDDVLMYVANKQDEEGRQIFTIRKKPCTDDGTPNGKLVLISERRHKQLKTNKRMYRCQQLCDPTPVGLETLNSKDIKLIKPEDIPQRLYKFMSIDPAGQSSSSKQDAWAIIVVGVDPYRDDIGASNVYILDAVIKQMDLIEAMTAICDMYVRNGRILRVGVEKVGMMTMEVHVAKALAAKGRRISIEKGNLQLLRPAGRAKDLRIEQNLCWPLSNGKVYMSTAVHQEAKERLKVEMEKFPFWHDDGIDCLAYVWDMLKDYNFQKRNDEVQQSKTLWERIGREEHEYPKYGWMGI